MPTKTHETDLKPELTEEAIEEARELIGTQLRTNKFGLRRRQSWNRTAAEDNIRQYARGYGDDNPLYWDPEYAANTCWRKMKAPPTFLFSVDRTTVAPKLPGIQWIYGGTRFEFERPVFVDDVFHVTVVPTKVEVKEGKRAGKFVLQEGEIKYYNQNDELVCTAIGRCLRVPRSHDNSSSVGQNREETYWTVDELKDIEDRILAQSRRGSETRYWDTVSVGDKIDTRIKGPLGVTDILSWYTGGGTPVYFPLELGVKERERHPSEAIRREDNGIIEHPAMGHLDKSIAGNVGIPRAYDVGFQRISYAMHPITDWMSDDGMVKMCDVSVDGMNYVGDVLYCQGEVTDTYIDKESDEHLVDIDFWGVNQDDERTVNGECTVQLPISSN